MVLPNALLAFYYGMRHQMDVVYTSQSGDAHICIPLCIGIFAACHGIPAERFLQQSLIILMGLYASHLLLIGAMGKLSRPAAVLMILLFSAFLRIGLFQ
jgi:cation:H+ antiporter